MAEEKETVIDGEFDEIENEPKLGKRVKNWFVDHRKTITNTALIAIGAVGAYTIGKVMKKESEDDNESDVPTLDAAPSFSDSIDLTTE